MCGIIGFNWKSAALVKKLAHLLEHRGPDQDGYYSDDSVSLGHRRLSIIDLSENGRQPMTNEDKSVFVVFNGEIYNFKEIKDELEKRGHEFYTDTDTEVIVHAYEEYGTDCVKHFNGQFSFCIYDKKNKKLFMARDRLGIRPLLYYSHFGKFMFASELKVFLESGLVKKEIDHNAMQHYLMFGYTPLEETIIKGVKKLAPGCHMTYDLETNELKVEKYWELSFSESIKGKEKDLVKELIERLDLSVKRRMIADVPVGAFLSGGIDSSLITALMRKHAKNLKTFSVSFDRAGFDESAHSKKVAELLKTDHYNVQFTAEDVKKHLLELVNFFDEPFADQSTLPTYLVAQVARKHVTVCLSGTGGDELFQGYPRHRHYSIVAKMRKMPSVLQKSAVAASRAFQIVSDRAGRAKNVLSASSLYEAYAQLFSADGQKFFEINTGLFNQFEQYFESGTVLDAYSFDQHEYLPNDLLHKEDMACLGTSLEGRVPFLDHEFVDWANHLATKYKYRRGRTKYILKKAAEQFLPKDIVYRRKQSFCVPFADYFRNELKQFAHDIMFNFKDYEYYDTSKLLKYWEEHQKGKKDYSQLFLTIIMFNLWFERWMSQ